MGITTSTLPIGNIILHPFFSVNLKKKCPFSSFIIREILVTLWCYSISSPIWFSCSCFSRRIFLRCSRFPPAFQQVVISGQFPLGWPSNSNPDSKKVQFKLLQFQLYPFRNRSQKHFLPLSIPRNKPLFTSAMKTSILLPFYKGISYLQTHCKYMAFLW